MDTMTAKVSSPEASRNTSLLESETESIETVVSKFCRECGGTLSANRISQSDVSQQAWLIAVELAGRYDPSKKVPLRAWLRWALPRRLTEWLRQETGYVRSRRQPRFRLTSLPEGGGPSSEAGGPPDSSLDVREAIGAVLLTPLQRELIRLVCDSGMTLVGAARNLKISKAIAYGEYRRIGYTLRGRLASYGEFA